ncbi:hypothetical protein REPUB_Repub02eG0206800 [Reevesia pubescens]
MVLLLYGMRIFFKLKQSLFLRDIFSLLGKLKNSALDAASSTCTHLIKTLTNVYFGARCWNWY